MPSQVNIERAYSLADLSPYSFKDRLLIRVIGLALFSIIKLVGATVKFEFEGWEHCEAVARDGHQAIYAGWHRHIFLFTYFWRERRVVVMQSRSFDAEYMARVIHRLGYGSVRGSSTRGHTGAAVEMIRLIKAGCPAGFLIDGPKGPRFVAKAGAILIAKKTGQPIIPMIVTAAKCWEIKKSWDRTLVPKPFTRARVIIAPPVYVPPDADGELFEAKRAEVQRALDELERKGEQWRATVS
jgi:lysophospholipid acyltransferase (LPLAT)-like uncharacterized protein